MSIPIVEELDLEGLAPGTLNRRWLHLVDDGLGLPVCVPVLVAKGATEGNVLVLTAAVHGNELNGIPVIHRLFDKLDPERLTGTLVGVPVVNVPAYHRHTRLMLEGFDLNHEFPGSPDSHFGAVYAYRLFDRVARHADALIDLHTASAGRVNCLYVRADLEIPRVKRMAYLQRPQIIVHNPPNDATLRGACDGMGIAALTVEIGSPGRFQQQYIERTGIGIRAVLGELDMLPRRRLAPRESPIVCTHSYWMFTDDGGLLEVFPGVTEHVRAGQPVARLVDAFGDTVKVYEAPEDAVVIGHTIDPVASSGSRIVHLGIPAAPDSHLLEVP
jgi:predicted deacylase